MSWIGYPVDRVVLTRADLERVFVALRALIVGTGEVDPNRAVAVDLAVTITRAIERGHGGEQ
jgi:hypothetical protein